MADIDWSAIREEALGDFALAALPPTLKLPALPQAVTQFVEKANKPDAKVKELGQIIDTDSGLTLELLKHVNSAFHGLRHQAGSVQQAISLLGIRQSKSFIISTGMQAAIRSKKSKLINQNSFWNASLQKAVFARELARLLKTDQDIAFSGALLQDFLLPVITNDLLEQYLPFVQNREEQPSCLCDFERKVLGFDHATAGAALASRWHLPDELVCCILFHHQGLRILAHPQLGRSAVAAVALSALLPDQLRQQWEGLHHLRKLEDKWASFSLKKIAEIVDTQQDELGLGIRNDFPLTRRVLAMDGDETAYDDGTINLTATA